MQSIQLPDGTSYSFTYDSYGEMTSVTLPTGGVIQYGWSNYQDSYNNKNRWLTSRTVGLDPATTFTPSVITQCASNGTGCQERVVVHKPSGDETAYVLTLNNGAWNTNVSAYTGSANGTPLATTTNTYSFQCSGCSTDYITKSTSVTTLSNGIQSQQQYIYNSPQTGKPTSFKEWDYYSGSAPSNPARETDYSYSGYDLSQVTVKDSNQAQISKTTYGYTSSATATSGVAQHGSANAGGPYLQSVTNWNSSGSDVSTSYVMDDTGTVLSSTDPNGTTSYGHDSSNTFITSVTPPTPLSGVVLTTSASYDFNSGVQTSTTDANGQTTQTSSFDTVGRPTQTNYPDGGKTQFNYFDSNNTQVWQYQTTNTRMDEVDQIDVFGRKSRIAVENGQATNSKYQTDYCYDSNSRLSFQSLSYQGAGWGTAKHCSGDGNAYSYDGLGRLTSIQTPDGTTSYQYAGRATKITDVNGIQKISQYDALGRITAVCEVSGTPYQGESPADCGLDIAGAGYKTYYTYDLANHKTTIMQGAQTRIFQTDSLGRTIYTKEPERGETTYNYVYNSTGLQVTRTRPKANQGDSNTKTNTTTQYDKVGRVVTVTYNDGITPGKYFYYDNNSYQSWSSQPTANLKGHLSVASVSAPMLLASSLFSYDSMGRVVTMWQCAPSICDTSNQASRPALQFGYDLAGNLTSEFDGASGQIVYGRSPAGEVTSITNQSYTDAHNPPNLVSNVVNGPFGPTSYTLGNGLAVVYQYDSMGRNIGNWLCNNGSTQVDCGNGNASTVFLSGSQISGNRLSWQCETVMGCHDYPHDDLDRLRVNESFGTVNGTYSYDRYGNRWQQTSPQGGPAPSYSFDTATNHINGLGYDAVGNMTNDGFHSYTYDAEGKILQVDGGMTAQYVYDALDHRVRTQNANATYEYLYDYAGHRISSWLEPSNFGNEGRIYWDDRQIAYRAWNGWTYFEHKDVTGTERMRTNFAGSIASTYASLPWGDGYAAYETDPAGDGLDNLHFAQLDKDSESSTEHAWFRQYSSTQGRWLSPDPYDGSYDMSDPQSFNRYSYVGNRPLSAIDPSGLFSFCGFTGIGSEAGAAISGLGYAQLGACIGTAIFDIFKLFGKPSFKGSLTPRPSAGIWDEHGSFHASPYSSIAAMIGDVGGWYPGGCEFGVCDGGPSAFGSGPSISGIKNYWAGIQEHVTKIAENPESWDVPHWRTEIKAFRKGIIKEASKRQGDVSKYLERIIGISLDDLNNINPELLFIVSPQEMCKTMPAPQRRTNPLCAPYLGGG